MLKIKKGLKKKGKHKKDRGEDLFDEKEFQKYKERKKKEAEEADQSGEKPSISEEGKQYELLSAVDSILQKSQEDLDRIKSTSYFQRKNVSSDNSQVPQSDSSSANKTAKWVTNFEEGARTEDSEDVKNNIDDEGNEVVDDVVVVLNDANDEDVEQESVGKSEESVRSDSPIELDDELFATSYVDAVITGEVKFAYIPESPTEEESDPFDTSIVNTVLREEDLVQKKKPLLDLKCAVDVLSGKVTNVPVSVKHKSCRKPRDVDLLSDCNDNKLETVTETKVSVVDEILTVGDCTSPKSPELIPISFCQAEDIPVEQTVQQEVDDISTIVAEFDLVVNTSSSHPEQTLVSEKELIPKSDQSEDLNSEEDDGFDFLAAESVAKHVLYELPSEGPDPFDTSNVDQVLDLAYKGLQEEPPVSEKKLPCKPAPPCRPPPPSGLEDQGADPSDPFDTSSVVTILNSSGQISDLVVEKQAPDILTSFELQSTSSTHNESGSRVELTVSSERESGETLVDQINLIETASDNFTDPKSEIISPEEDLFTAFGAERLVSAVESNRDQLVNIQRLGESQGCKVASDERNTDLHKEIDSREETEDPFNTSFADALISNECKPATSYTREEVLIVEEEIFDPLARKDSSLTNIDIVEHLAEPESNSFKFQSGDDLFDLDKDPFDTSDANVVLGLKDNVVENLTTEEPPSLSLDTTAPLVVPPHVDFDPLNRSNTFEYLEDDDFDPRKDSPSPDGEGDPEPLIEAVAQTERPLVSDSVCKLQPEEDLFDLDKDPFDTTEAEVVLKLERDLVKVDGDCQVEPTSTKSPEDDSDIHHFDPLLSGTKITSEQSQVEDLAQVINNKNNSFVVSKLQPEGDLFDLDKDPFDTSDVDSLIKNNASKDNLDTSLTVEVPISPSSDPFDTSAVEVIIEQSSKVLTRTLSNKKKPIVSALQPEEDLFDLDKDPFDTSEIDSIVNKSR